MKFTRRKGLLGLAATGILATALANSLADRSEQRERGEKPVALKCAETAGTTAAENVDYCPPCGRAFTPEISQRFLEHYTAPDEGR